MSKCCFWPISKLLFLATACVCALTCVPVWRSYSDTIHYLWKMSKASPGKGCSDYVAPSPVDERVTSKGVVNMLGPGSAAVAARVDTLFPPACGFPIDQWFPTWGTCTLAVHLPIWKGTFIVQPQQINFETWNWVYLQSSKIPKVILKIQWIFVFSLSLLVIRNVTGRCLSVEILKGYMVRESLRTPAIDWLPHTAEQANKLSASLTTTTTYVRRSGRIKMECGVGDNPTKLRTLIQDNGTHPPGITLTRRAWVRLNRFCTGVGRFRSCLYKWGMASSAACEGGVEERTVDHVVLQCPIHRPLHGLHGLTVLDDETTEWLLNTCPEI